MVLRLCYGRKWWRFFHYRKSTDNKWYLDIIFCSMQTLHCAISTPQQNVGWYIVIQQSLSLTIVRRIESLTSANNSGICQVPVIRAHWNVHSIPADLNATSKGIFIVHIITTSTLNKLDPAFIVALHSGWGCRNGGCWWGSGRTGWLQIEKVHIHDFVIETN